MSNKSIKLLKDYITKCCSCQINNIETQIYIDINKEVCVEITDKNLMFPDFQQLVDYIIPLYIDLGILQPKQMYNKYFILGKRFTWNKIKQLKVSDLDYSISKIKWQSIYDVFENKNELNKDTLLLFNLVF